jgi:hypothetical protein
LSNHHYTAVEQQNKITSPLSFNLKVVSATQGTRYFGRRKNNITFKQGCRSGSGLDPDSMTLWILIRNPDPWARKMKKKSTF